MTNTTSPLTPNHTDAILDLICHLANALYLANAITLPTFDSQVGDAAYGATYTALKVTTRRLVELLPNLAEAPDAYLDDLCADIIDAIHDNIPDIRPADLRRIFTHIGLTLPTQPE